MPENLQGAFVRRQELVCTEAELEMYGSKILLENEILYVRLESGAIALKIGDGVTPISDLPLQTNLPQITGDDDHKVLMAHNGLWVAKNLSSLEYLGHVNAVVSTQLDEDGNVSLYFLGEDMSMSPTGQYYSDGSVIKELIYDADMLMIQVHRSYGEEMPIFIGGVGKSYNASSGGQIVGVDLYGGAYFLAEEVANAIFGEYMTAETVDFYAYKLPRN